MSFSTTLTTLVGVLGLANLVLALGLTRRVTDHDHQLDDIAHHPPAEAVAERGESEAELR